MSLVDLHGAIWAVAGMVSGGIVGYRIWGATGAVLGVPVGLGAGVVGLCATVFVIALVLKVSVGGTLFSPANESKTASDEETDT